MQGGEVPWFGKRERERKKRLEQRKSERVGVVRGCGERVRFAWS
jgi:hypothetical protein